MTGAAPTAQPSGRDPNRGLDLLRATEAAAIAAGRWLGSGNRNGALSSSEEMMAKALAATQWDARIVIGSEAEASHLRAGTHIGAGQERLDLVVVPVDGISLIARGVGQALSIAAVTGPGAVPAIPPVAYMHKIAVGPDAVGSIDVSDSAENNLRRVAFAKNRGVADLTVIMLDRPRHQALIEEVRQLGARISLISDGDVGAALMAAWESTGIDVFIGSGGAREAVVGACAVRCMGGEMQCRPWIRNAEEEDAVRAGGWDLDCVLKMDALAPSSDVSVAVTGVSGAGILRGVVYHGDWYESHSMVMRSRTGTVREVVSRHHIGQRQSTRPRQEHRRS